MTAQLMPPLPDDLGVGQVAVAKIRMGIAERRMSAMSVVAFNVGYENDLVRASARRQFYEARENHDYAKRVMEAYQ